MDFINYTWSGGNKVEIILALQTLLDNLHMEKSQKAAAIAEAQSHGGFGLEGKRGVVQLKLFERVL